MSTSIGRVMGAPGSDHDSRPLYAQLKEALTKRIVEGEWKPGQTIPSEHEIANEYQVSQGTARKAVGLLVEQNVLVRRQGSGTFVASHDWQSTVTQVFKLVGETGRVDIPQVKTIDYTISTADPLEVSKLKLRRNAKVARVRRVRLNDGRPFIVERLILPMGLFNGIEEDIRAGLPQQLYGFYSRRYGLLVKEATENLRAVNATEEDCQLLGVGPNHPLLEIDRVVFSLQGFPLEWRISHCDTSHHTYQNVTR